MFTGCTSAVLKGLQLVSARSMATVAKSSGNVTLPITLHGIDGRYATALYTAAVKSNQLDIVDQELGKIKSVVDKDEKIRLFLENPVLSASAKKQGVESIMSSYSELTRNFFVLLAENRRLSETTGIIGSFGELMAAHKGETTVVVTTSKPLDSRMEGQLKTALSKGSVIRKGSNVKIVSKVNPSILGGMIVEVGDKSIDMSISSRISKLNKLLTDSI